MTEDNDLFSEQDSTQDDTSSKKRTWKVEKGKNREIIPSGISRRTAHDDMLALFDVEDVLDIPEYASTQMTIDDVHRIAGTNGFKSISTFTGCGGSATGFAMAGWRELMATEFVDAARNTFASNYESTVIEPQELLALAEQWFADNEELASGAGVQLISNKQVKVKDKVVQPSLSWELIQDELPDSDEARDVFSQMRLWVNDQAFSAHADEIANGKIILWGDDIRGLDPYSMMDALGLEPGELDCFEGSPPCKSFSMAGVREDKWGKVAAYSGERKQKSDDLFFEYMRLVLAFRPKSFVAENVQGLALGAAVDHVLKPFEEEMRQAGYIVDHRLLNAADFGVPQERPRLFVQGIRVGLVDKLGRQIKPAWPKDQEYRYTVNQAISGVESTIEQITESWLGTKADLFSTHGDVPEEVIKKFWKDRFNIKDTDSRFAVGAAWYILGPGGSPENTYFQLVRSHPDRPVPTITATSAGNIAAAGITHPNECRKFTTPELRALFTFPRDYKFDGNTEQQGERMGRSVPPYLMKAIAEKLASTLKKVHKDNGAKL